MPFSEKLELDLDADIDTALPLGNPDGDPQSIVLALPGTHAPILAMSRDPRHGDVIVPHFFLTTETPEGLLSLGSIIAKNGKDLMPLFHEINGSNTRKFLVFPFLFNRGKKSLDFIQMALELGNLAVRSKFSCAYLIMDCHLIITKDGASSVPEEYPGAFNHLKMS